MLEVGKVFKVPYPFISVKASKEDRIFGLGVEDYWVRGVKRWVENQTYDYPGELFISCDAEGFAEVEILAITEMPRRIKTRVLFMLKFIDPDGNKTSSGVKMESLDNLTKRLNSNFYGTEYDSYE